MLQYHHYSVPTTQELEPVRYSKQHGWWVISDFRSNPYRIGIMRIAPNSPLPETLKKYPHICFKVDNIEEAIKGKEITVPLHINAAHKLKMAFTLIDGVNVEFVEAGEGSEFA